MPKDSPNLSRRLASSATENDPLSQTSVMPLSEGKEASVMVITEAPAASLARRAFEATVDTIRMRVWTFNFQPQNSGGRGGWRASDAPKLKRQLVHDRLDP